MTLESVCKPAPFLEQCLQLPALVLSDWDRYFILAVIMLVYWVVIMWFTGRAR